MLLRRGRAERLVCGGLRALTLQTPHGLKCIAGRRAGLTFLADSCDRHGYFGPVSLPVILMYPRTMAQTLRRACRRGVSWHAEWPLGPRRLTPRAAWVSADTRDGATDRIVGGDQIIQV